MHWWKFVGSCVILGREVGSSPERLQGRERIWGGRRAAAHTRRQPPSILSPNSKFKFRKFRGKFQAPNSSTSFVSENFWKLQAPDSSSWSDSGNFRKFQAPDSSCIWKLPQVSGSRFQLVVRFWKLPKFQAPDSSKGGPILEVIGCR
jgi:hypothetical protein